MGVESRPYVGTWRLGRQRLVQYCPDALVYINGATSLPGCPKCNSKIDIQQYMTEVSVDASTDPTGASASFTLSVPVHDLNAFTRDAQFLLHPGLEVHVYLRGYFPIKGLYSNTDQPTSTQNVTLSGSSTNYFSEPMVSGNSIRYPDKIKTGGSSAWRANNPGNLVATKFTEQMGAIKGVSLPWGKVKGRGNFAIFPDEATGENANRAQMLGSYKNLSISQAMQKYAPLLKSADGKTVLTDPVKYAQRLSAAVGVPDTTLVKDLTPAQLNKFLATIKVVEGWIPGTESLIPQAPANPGTPTVVQAIPGSPRLSDQNLDGYNIEDVLAYPYYHVFHGVVSQVGHSYSAGVQTITVQCVSMLHFWQYHQMSTNASMFGARPTNSKLKMSMVGHNFTGWHPYQIIYYLHSDTGGAAAGVSWALSQKTSQETREPLTGESFFSLNIKYWQQRFNKREIKLRMHGATGQLFNSAQSSYLGRTSSEELTSALKGTLGKIKPSGTAGQNLNQSTATALGLDGMMKNLRWAEKSMAVEGSGYDINMTEMQAFVSNLGQWGQVALFESSYESKLDIASKVCEVTGFEFYQDVDGDFVFKPPMYNLDTSTSRIYRIEDIDIINISFDEKEPQATYMTCKGTPFQGLAGHGIENEWGVQGQYIDYRLVAQFGWRPANYESSYFTDPRQMFFASVNRLDIMNAPSKSASVTIPERPEIRPGYPVYIPYLDCYYYCSSFAHSHSVGGECTTSLQLVGKRSKFYAPGDPKKVGIDAIDLKNTAFPQRPLHSLGLDERPELAGFPNVVMALDPEQLSPLFFVVGSDIDDLAKPETLRNLLKMGIELGVVSTENRDNPGPYYFMSEGPSQTQTFYYNPGESATTKSLAGGVIDLQALVQKSIAVTKGQTANIMTMAKQQQALLGKIETETQKLMQISASKTANDQKTDAVKAQSAKIALSNAELAAMTSAIAGVNTDDASIAKAADLAPLTNLIKSISDKYYSTTSGGKHGDFNDAATLLDMLSDKKAIFSGNQLPGSYRYYSASHPDASQQGQAGLDITVNVDAGGKKSKKVTTSSEASALSPKWQNCEVEGFVATERIQAPNGSSPEVKRGKVKPKRGIHVLTSDPQGEVRPTSEIRELMFAVHSTTLPGKKTGTKRTPSTSDLTTDFRSALLKNAVSSVGSPANTDTISSVMANWSTTFQDNVGLSLGVSNSVIYSNPSTMSLPPLTLSFQNPTVVIYKGIGFPVETSMGTYKFQDTTGTIVTFSGCQKTTLKSFWAVLAEIYASDMYASFASAKDVWSKDLRALDTDNAVVTQAETAFYSSMYSLYGVKQPSKGQVKTSHTTNAKNPIHSPVFPVSDARGYEVIGSYRYGRDIDIDPNGALDMIHKSGSQDRKDLELALQYLNRQTIEDMVDSMIRGRTIWVSVPDPPVPGKAQTYKSVPVTGGRAAQDVERRVLEQLRRHLTDNQLLDMGLLRQTGDPNMLEMNLSNWFSEASKESLQKVSLVNAAYSLADLTASSGNTCSCKAAEADILLDAADKQEYLRVTPSEEDQDLDPVTAWEVRTTKVTVQDWQLSQEALRGALSPPRTSSVVGTVMDVFGIGDGNQSPFTEEFKKLQARKEQLLLQARAIDVPGGD